jgi:hypothetical protein
VAVSRQPGVKTIDNSRCLQGPLVLGLPAVGHNVVVPRLVTTCDERHACRRVIVLAIVGSLAAAPRGAVGTAPLCTTDVASRTRQRFEPSTPPTQLQTVEPKLLLSAVLLECTIAGMATCTLTHMTEITPARELIQGLSGQPGLPQLLIRVARHRRWSDTFPPRPAVR